MQEVSKTAKKLPTWAIPAAAGAALGLYTLYKRSHAPAPAAAPVQSIATPRQTASGLAGADYGDVQGLLADQNTRNQEANAALQTDSAAKLAALQAAFGDSQAAAQAAQDARDAALQSAFSSGLSSLTDRLNALPANSTSQPPAPVSGNGSGILPAPTNPTPAVPVTSPVNTAAPVVPVVSRPVLAPPLPAPAPTPAPAPVPTPAPTRSNPGADWAAFAYYLGGKGWSPGGLHYAGEIQQINWNAPPYSASEPPPPSGVYPAAPLPVNFNGNHAAARYPYGVNPWSESAYIRTLRWTADYMTTHPTANPQTVWDSMVGRLMRDIGPLRGTNWYDTGFDLGSVRNSPFLDGDGTPNPAYRPL